MVDAIVELAPIDFGWFAFWPGDKDAPAIPIVAWGKVRFDEPAGPAYRWYPVAVLQGALTPLDDRTMELVHASQIAAATAQKRPGNGQIHLPRR